MDNKKAFWSELDELGEDKVREKLENYGNRRRGAVDEWLRKKDQEKSDVRARSKEAISLESLKTAKTANNIMTVSAIIAVIAIIVTALIFYLQ